MTTKKTVLVTGCSKGGIGDALAQEFHKRGLRVFAAARNLEKVQHLKEMGLDVIQLDVEKTESIQDAATKIGELTDGKLDILVNNAGIGYHAPMTDCDMAAAKKLFDVNFFGLIEVTKIFSRQLVAAQGMVINIGSVAGKIPLLFQGIYNASKAAVQLISDNMRVEMALLGVKVIHVVTGGIRTNFIGNGQHYDFPKDSLYYPVRDVLEPALKGEVSDAMLIMPPAEYASKVVDNALSRWPKVQLWCGNQTFVAWLVTTFMWHSYGDSTLWKMFGADKIGSSLRKQYQK